MAVGHLSLVFSGKITIDMLEVYISDSFWPLAHKHTHQQQFQVAQLFLWAPMRLKNIKGFWKVKGVQKRQCLSHLMNFRFLSQSRMWAFPLCVCVCVLCDVFGCVWQVDAWEEERLCDGGCKLSAFEFNDESVFLCHATIWS